MFKSKHQLQIELDPTDKPFYTVGDVVSGQIRVFASKELTLTNIQVKLRCEEWSEVAEDDKMRQIELRRGGRRREHDRMRRAKGKKEFVRHYSNTITVYPDHVGPETHKCILKEGEHVFPFVFELPSRLESYPPHCPIFTQNGLKVGVKWGVKAVIHRPGTLQLNVREIVDVELYPPPKNGDYAVDLSVPTELSGFMGLDHMPPTSLFGRIKAAFTDSPNTSVVATLQYPRQGIPQLGLDPHFLLKAGVTDATRAPPAATIQRVALVIVQNCEARAKGLKDIYQTEYKLGEAKVAYALKKLNDLSETVQGFELHDLLPPAFETDLLKVWYDLRIEIDVITAQTNAPVQKLTQAVSVPIISPVKCWYATHDYIEPAIRTPSKGQFSVEPDSPSSSESSRSDRKVPRKPSVADADASLPSYFESEGRQNSSNPYNTTRNSSAGSPRTKN